MLGAARADFPPMEDMQRLAATGIPAPQLQIEPFFLRHPILASLKLMRMSNVKISVPYTELPRLLSAQCRCW